MGNYFLDLNGRPHLKWIVINDNDSHFHLLVSKYINDNEEVICMFVMNACFETDKADEQRLMAKAQKNQKEIEGAKGLVSYECWRTEHKDTVEYVFVSKWEKQDDFKAWISREEHVNEHKARRQMQRESGVKPQSALKKTLRSYEVYSVATEAAK